VRDYPAIPLHPASPNLGWGATGSPLPSSHLRWVTGRSMLATPHLPSSSLPPSTSFGVDCVAAKNLPATPHLPLLIPPPPHLPPCWIVGGSNRRAGGRRSLTHPTYQHSPLPLPTWPPHGPVLCVRGSMPTKISADLMCLHDCCMVKGI
jgi:hypothetical protein